MVWLREEIARKQVEINTHQRQYKEMLDNTFEIRESPIRREVGVDNPSIQKLEKEMKAIKDII